MDVQETVYWIWMAVSAVLCFGLFGISLSGKEEGRWKLVWWSLCLGITLGLLCAKLTYYLCQLDFMIAEGWKESLLSLEPDGMSFFGGVAGVCFGVALAAKICRKSPGMLLNQFAPWGLVLGALSRFGEYFLGWTGFGPYLENTTFCFFPLARAVSYGEDWTEWYLAVFVLEGISLLTVAAVSKAVMKEHRFVRSLFYLCLPQILLENLRLSSFMWLFCIRVEQLVCMVAITAILILYCVHSQGMPRRFLPVGIAVLCAGFFIVCEFAMEGKIPFLRFLDLFACYALMLAGQVVLAVTEVRSFRKMTAR